MIILSTNTFLIMGMHYIRLIKNSLSYWRNTYNQ